MHRVARNDMDVANCTLVSIVTTAANRAIATSQLIVSFILCTPALAVFRDILHKKTVVYESYTKVKYIENRIH